MMPKAASLAEGRFSVGHEALGRDGLDLMELEFSKQNIENEKGSVCSIETVKSI